MKERKILTKEELKERAVRFFDRYEKEIEQIKDLLEIKLKQICLAYTIENRLPPEALIVTARTKTLKSFLKKLEKKGWPQFYFPTEIITDLIGARITSWFLDDCSRVLDYINKSSHFSISNESIEDYIQNPKKSGYRGIHILASVSYDSVQRTESGEISVVPEEMITEIQIRTKLQDAWGDITHEFHYKAKHLGVNDDNLENFLSDISDRLLQEDRTLIKFRDVYQSLADDKLKKGKREGFKDEE
ncbi:GTP pyrophosphokinase [Aequorivita soesokkakensis]|uniref:GTP pyrophosphokinase n=1 Tax=Aequorivita soesokkakensis TaxID=1385699 RepID=A0A1A9LCM0_9FLAO|nr:GTP pyrophosphokinase [Aequorivita soesokkakensis]OAD90432.1 GTP pyrophosphokinase [Aequorivita soesokkakensis]